jgi:hypothetical protein
VTRWSQSEWIAMPSVTALITLIDDELLSQ